MLKINCKGTILVVEDEASLQKAILLKLKKDDFQVVISATVDEAISQLKKEKEVCLIWLDHYLLGKKNGLDFVAEIKQNEKWKNIPIFVVTNTTSQDKLGDYVNYGVNKYYTKANFRLDEIIRDINQELNK